MREILLSPVSRQCALVSSSHRSLVRLSSSSRHSCLLTGLSTLGANMCSMAIGGTHEFSGSDDVGSQKIAELTGHPVESSRPPSPSTNSRAERLNQCSLRFRPHSVVPFSGTGWDKKRQRQRHGTMTEKNPGSSAQVRWAGHAMENGTPVFENGDKTCQRSLDSGRRQQHNNSSTGSRSKC